MEESSAPAPADADADAASVTLPEVYEDAPEDWRLSMAVEDGAEDETRSPNSRGLGRAY